MLRKFLLVILVGASLSSSAQQTMLTLEEAISQALKNNFDIRLVRNDSASYAIDNSYAWAAFLPRVNGTAGRVWNSNAQKQELSNGTKRDTSGIKSTNLTGAINLNWTLFDGFRMFATRDKLAEFVRLGELSVQSQIVNTVASIRNNYYDIVRQKQQLKAILDQMSINEERVKLSDRKLSVGLGAKPELLQAKLDLNAQKAAVLQQNTLIEQLKGQLNQLIGFDLNSTGYDVSEEIPFDNNLSLETLRGNVSKGNPGLQVASKNIDIARITIRENKAGYYPVLSFNSAYNFSRTENNTVINTFTPLFNQNRGLNYGIGLTVPILNGFNTTRLVRQSKLELQYQQLVFENLRTQVDIGLNNSFKDYELQKKSLQLEEENIALAKENVAIALERYRQGVSTFLELREAQKSLEDGYNRLIAARYNLKLAETELLRLTGALIR
ncbi:MAG: TolC family protein [Gemmatimonadaceae bacterium]|nr:TolC family protein [Chitinophagaceae bacterium]